MTLPTFDELQSQIQKRYHAGNYTEVLELVTNNADRFPDQAPLFYYWRICMTALLEKPAESIQLLGDVLDRGIWYGDVLLRKSPSLKSLQDLPEFEKLAIVNHQLQKQEMEHIYKLITLRPEGICQEGGLPCPMLLGLHANSSTAQASLDFWKPAASAGWLVAVPQSSQAMWKGAYVWDDLDITKTEIQRHFITLQQQYPIDPHQTIIAGHAMGGEVAIWLALSGSVQVNGFVAIGPGGHFIDDLDNWRPWIEASFGQALRGVILLGEEDHSVSQSDINSLVGLLNEVGIPCDIEVIPGVGHDFDPEYESSLLQGLDSILEEI